MANLGYDPNLDYNKLISQTKDANEKARLNKELNNKINNETGSYAKSYNLGASGIQGTVDASVAELNNRAAVAKGETAKANTGAYMAYKKSIDPYGSNAEQAASLGLSGSGWNNKNNANHKVSYNKTIADNKTNLTNSNNEINLMKNSVNAQGVKDKNSLYSDYANQNKTYKEIKAEKLADETKYNNERKQSKAEQLAAENYNKALNKAQSTGDYSGMKAYGWSKDEIRKANKR